MEFKLAEAIAKKHRALKHCNKLLAEIDKKGEAQVILNNTGVTFIVHKGDAMYLKLSTTRAHLVEDIASYEIVKKAETSSAPQQEEETVPAVPSSREGFLAKKREYMRARREKETPEQREKRLAKHREYMKGYNAKKRALLAGAEAD